MKLNRNSKIFINYFLGPLLFVWLSWSIYRQVQRQPGLENAWRLIMQQTAHPDFAEGGKAFIERRAPRWQPHSSLDPPDGRDGSMGPAIGEAPQDH